LISATARACDKAGFPSCIVADAVSSEAMVADNNRRCCDSPYVVQGVYRCSRLISINFHNLSCISLFDSACHALPRNISDVHIAVASPSITVAMTEFW